MNKNSRNSWKWPKAPSKYTDEDKRQIIGKEVEIAVRYAFDTHFYQWE